MKKILILIIAMTGMFSCKKENIKPNNSTLDIQVKVYAKSKDDNHIIATTKTIALKLQ